MAVNNIPNDKLLTDLLINGNGYFYRRVEKIPKHAIEQVFRDVAADKESNQYLVRQVRNVHLVGSKSILYSLCIIRYIDKPSFLREPIPNWHETKYSFLLIIEVDDHVAVYKRNVSNMGELDHYIEPLDYMVISRLYVDAGTNFEKLYMSQLSTSEHSIRNQSMEANSLAGMVSRLGATKKVIHNLRVSNGRDRQSISCNTSRINNMSEKNDLNMFFSWVVETCALIDAFQPKSTYLDNFSTPVSYVAHKDSLQPSTVLVKLDKLKDDRERQRIGRIYRVDSSGDEQGGVLLDELLRTVEGSFEVVPDGQRYKVQNPTYDDMEVRMNEKSIKIRSAKLKSIMLDFEGEKIDLLAYLNMRNDFIVNFYNVEFVYTMNKLWKDHRLLADLEGFMSVFVDHAELAHVKSEKGSFKKGQTSFDNDSLFGFITGTLSASAEVLICDDLNDEWADFIAIESDGLAFLHAKYVDSPGLSASNLHDVIGQAQKNLGYLQPDDSILTGKMTKWGRTYNNANQKTSISRLVIPPKGGQSLQDAYTKCLGQPNTKKRVRLVITSISKSTLSDALAKLKAGTPFARKAETIQILWFVSSLIAACQDRGDDLYIHCLP